jgi:hypothetical protein
MVSCQADNSGTLFFDFSNDGTNATTFPVNGFKISSDIHEFHTAVKGPRYFRVRLENDAGDQSYLRLYTYYGAFRQGNSPLNQTVSLDTDASHVRPTDFADEVRAGRRTGVTGWNKFGYNPSLANGSAAPVAVQGGAWSYMKTAEPLTVTYNASTDGASAGATGAIDLTVWYIDSAGLPQTATHTLGDDGSDTTSFSTFGINRVAVSSSGSAEGNVNDITMTSSAAGTQALVPAGEGVTQQVIFYVGSNHTAVARWLWINVNKVGGTGPVATIKGYVWNRNVATKFEVFRHTIDAGVENTVSIEDPVGFVLNSTDVLWFECLSNTNATIANMRVSLREYQNT